MSKTERLFDIQQHDETLILVPFADLTAFDEFDEDARVVVQRFADAGLRNIVLDFSGTDYFVSTALGFFLILWKQVRSADGNMVLCNVSEHEMEILTLTRLDSLWTICNTRDEALRTLQTSEP